MKNQVAVVQVVRQVHDAWLRLIQIPARREGEEVPANLCSIYRAMIYADALVRYPRSLSGSVWITSAFYPNRAFELNLASPYQFEYINLVRCCSGWGSLSSDSFENFARVQILDLLYASK